MQGEFADSGQQGLLASLGALGDEVVLPLLDLGESERVLTSSLRGGGLALEDVDDEGCFAFGGPTLRTVGIGLDFKGGRCDGGFGLTHGRDLHVEGER
jgi:hypothetical protein